MACSGTKGHVFVKTLKKCEHQVIVAIRNNLKDVAWFLEDRDIIPYNFYKRITNPKTREDPDDLAREVHVALIEKVEEDPSRYNVFLDCIREISAVTANKLDEAYAELLEKQGTAGAGPDGTANAPAGATGKEEAEREEEIGKDKLRGGFFTGERRDYYYDVPPGTTYLKFHTEESSPSALNIGIGNGQATLNWNKGDKQAHVHAWVNGAIGPPNEISWTVVAKFK